MEAKKQVLSFTEFINEGFKIIGGLEETSGLAVNEQESLSNVKSRMALAGSTPDATNNAGALAQFEKIDGVTIKGKPIDDKKALFKDQSSVKNSTQFWEIKEKTRKEKNYLKIGNQIITGDDKGKTVYITVSTKYLAENPIEASGNGIFALGRAINLLRKEELAKGGGTNIIIAMNTKKADSFVANAETGFQATLGNWDNAIMRTFVVSEGVIPNEKHITNNVNMAKRAINNPDLPNAEDALNMNAKPQLPKEYNEKLRKIDPIDATNFVNKIKDKKIKSYTDELDKYVDEFVDTFFTTYIETQAKRFKAYLDIEAKELGIDAKLFDDLKKYIDGWKTEQSGKKGEYKESAKNAIKVLFTQKNQTGSVSRPGAATSVKRIEGTVGKIK